MTKFFNTFLSLDDIIEAYKTGSFPNAYCLLWNKEQSVRLLASESDKYIFTESRKGIELDGCTRVQIFES